MTSIEIERRVSVEIPLVIGNTYLRHSVQLRVHSVVCSAIEAEDSVEHRAD